MTPASSAGCGPTGVLATDDIDEILALGADCVLYMPQECNVDDVCRLLESGANVVTTRGEFHHPASMDPAVAGEGRGRLRARWHLRSTAPAAAPASSPRPCPSC